MNSIEIQPGLIIPVKEGTREIYRRIAEDSHRIGDLSMEDFIKLRVG